ncbi:MAG TPA: SDR family NAD(P)-dependent oxidoreductase [Terriglobia bacterium]|nr:SDR family NAD(P)-dependent oxidoreductase [Terriglobia bacterium]
MTMTSFVEVARSRAAQDPRRRAYTFTEFRPEPQETHLTYGQLDQRARAIALQLRSAAQKGDRALLLYPAGLDFICGFMGCLYAGVIAVPTPISRQGRRNERLQRIVADSGASVILSTTAVKRSLEMVAAANERLSWICTDEVEDLDTTGLDEALPVSDAIAFLQYSSGSTGHPKGIMISHANLIHQSSVIHALSDATRDSCLVSWLPMFHDMGLIMGVLQPLYAGYPGILMSPEAFGESPYRWLQAISDHWADISVAPNFAYEMCIRRIPPHLRRTLDLSRWRAAINAAEPVRAKTITDFAEAFAESGFRRNVFRPAYGLAEATLMVSGGGHQDVAERCFSSDALEENRIVPVPPEHKNARRLVGCGVPVSTQRVLIVHPKTRRPCPPDEVGEIWVKGPSVGRGYWHRSEDTIETFQSQLSIGDGPYLRTGDLGFLCDGELFICGRLKDLIIIRGRNHHAPDIEMTVEGCHNALQPSCGAVFSVEMDKEERLVVVHELDRSFKSADQSALDPVIAAIRQAVAEQHELQVHSVVLVRHGTVPKTSSGKIRRLECRSRFLDGKLNVRAAWSADQPAGESSTDGRRGLAASPEALKPASDASERHDSDSLRKIRSWLVHEVARRMACDPAAIETGKPLKELGFNSEDLLKLTRAIEMQFSCMLPTTLLMDFPTIQDVAEQLASSGRKMRDEQSRKAQAPSLQQPAREKSNEPIAVIGMGCRFPGASGPRAFWKVLCDGIDTVTEVPPDRWDIDEVYDPNPVAPGKMNTRCGGFLKNIDEMDRNFFEISIREAVRMDPQHRLMMEVAWEALEDAGLVAEQLAGSQTGVFVGISGSDYAQFQFADPAMSDAYAGLGSALTIAASRVSHFLNLRGPAIAIDTACSSSLMAIHLACASLQQGECSLALAGGVNVILSPVTTMSLTKAGMMSPDGRCKAFDSRANGYVRSEGAGMIVLKPLSRAVADGDPIYAVIRGTASNQDGRSSGLAAPNGEAQQAVIMAACKDADISPGMLDYVEAHGTGTPVGDPIEANALGAVLRMDREPGSICAIGSVKTNIGHAESAAGVASIIKAALILRHRQIPPSLHFEQPNPVIPFDDLPVKVQTSLGPLPETSRPARVGVNGFGVGGTNVHIVLEEAPVSSVGEPGKQAAADRPFVLPLSARGPASLKAGAAAMVDFLCEPGIEDALQDMCYTASQRRDQLEHRLAVVGRTAADLAANLKEYVDHGHHTAVATGFVSPQTKGAPKMAFVFSGQGSQWRGMGCGLLAAEPVFRRVIEECDATLRPHTGWSLVDELRAEPSRSRLDETEVAQPAIFSLQVALTALFKSWGIVPDALAGHSMGEVAAAHVAGILTLEDALRLIARRGKLMQGATGLGRMASVELSRADAEAMLNGWSDRISVAAVNSPNSVVLSGEQGALGTLLEKLDRQGIVSVPLPVNYAFHSPQMEPFKDHMTAMLNGLQSSSPRIPLFSTVRGEWCNGHLLDAPYWGANIRQPVLLSSAIEGLAKDGIQVFLEMGPHPVISGYISRTLKSIAMRGHVIPSLRREQDEQTSVLSTFAALHTLGRAGDWTALYPEGKVCQTLPTYRWDRQRFWLDGRKSARRKAAAHPLLGHRLPVAQPVWQNKLDGHALPFLKDLRFRTRGLLPTGLVMELALAASSETFGSVTHDLTDITFDAAAELPEGETSVSVQATASAEKDGTTVVRVCTQSADTNDETPGWKTHVTARCKARPSNDGWTPRPLQLDELQGVCREQFDGAEFYGRLAESGILYGPSLRAAETVARGEGVALLKMRVPEPVRSGKERYCIHPVLLETAAQACRVVYGMQGFQMDLSHVQRVSVFRSDNPDECIYAYVRRRTAVESGEGIERCDVWISDESGAIVAMLEGAQFKLRQNEARLGPPTDPADWLYDIAWHPAPLGRDKSGNWTGQGTWVILADENGTADELAEQLRSQDERAILVRRGHEFQRVADDLFTVSPSSPEDMRLALAEALASHTSPCRGIVHLWSMDVPSRAISAVSIDEDQTLSSISITHVVQAVASAQLGRPPRLWIATRGAQQVAEDAGPIALSQSTVWGLGKVIAIEHPEFRCCRIDVSLSCTPDEVQSLFEECWSNDTEDQVALRGTERYAARLVRHVLAGSETSNSGPVRRFPLPDEVEIRVSFAGLDSRDLMRSGDAAAADVHTQIGDECSGTVVRIGTRVTGLQVGQEVVALASRCVTPYVTVKASSVVDRPSNLSPEQASTSPRAFLAAAYSLYKAARLTEGEHVLIHGAGGSVGLAAVEMSRRLGATVFVSAETEGEREYLAEIGLEHVFNAHSLSFASEILKLTGGRGVDVVLNCLPGSGAADCLPALGAFGRCVDASISQTGRRPQTTMLGSAGSVSFHTVDVDHLLRERPEEIREMLGKLMIRFFTGALNPLPVKAFPMDQAADALQSLTKSERPARVAIRLPETLEITAEADRPLWRDDATYLITGGLGGLGLAIARRMVEHGARHLTLVGRSAPSAKTQEAIAELKEYGAHCMVASVDVSDEQQVRNLLSTIRESMPPLRGIIHAAGILANNLLVNLDEARFRSVMPSKVTGAWHLHNLTADTPLDFFVLFSSLASLIGSHGQGNYAAANAFLDGLAVYRRSLGLPGLAIAWGPWSEIGMAADVHNLAKLGELGMGMLVPDKALDLLEKLTHSSSGLVGAIAMDWQLWSKGFPLAAQAPFVSNLIPREEHAKREGGILNATALAGLEPEARIELLESTIQKSVCQTLRLDPSVMGRDVPLSAVGLDSIVALELKVRIESNIDVVVHTPSLLKSPTVQQMAVQFLAQMMNVPDANAPAAKETPAVVEPAVETSDPEALLNQLDQLSDSEVASLLSSMAEGA